MAKVIPLAGQANMCSFPIYFLRHGETDWNKELRFQGRQDIPLNQTGKVQAARNGRILAQHLDNLDGFSVFVSPLGRTQETFELMLEASGFERPDVRLEERLIEVSFGDWEGITLDELKQRVPDQIAGREKVKWGMVPPNGESYAMLAERVKSWLEEQQGPCLVVSHGGVMRTLRYLLENLAGDKAARLKTPQDRIYYWDGRRADWL
jgi:probable phosphoglycerate mutase